MSILNEILSGLDWRGLAQRIRRETRNREVHQPLISVYRWWARRPHSVIGDILSAAASELSPDSLISDPFSGGGTVAIEAARRGYRVYAQDLHPWAIWGLQGCLTPVDVGRFSGAGRKFLNALRDSEQSRYSSSCPEHGASTTVHTFRVRVGNCTDCGGEIALFPYSLISVASRSREENFAHYGCRKCGRVSRHRMTTKRPRCSFCGSVMAEARTPLMAGTQTKCPHCRRLCNMDECWGHVEWSVVLVQRLCKIGERTTLHFDLPSVEDTERASAPPGRSHPKSLLGTIPDGLETARLKAAGFVRWVDLYPPRQTDVLLAAGQLLAEFDLEVGIRDRLATCIVGASEMAGHLCRWDRFHPKIFESLANHRYSVTGLAVEPNPISPQGRGSLQRRLMASVVAARWAQENLPRGLSVSHYTLDSGDQNPNWGERSVVLAQGSSERQLPEDQSVTLSITDPPYYDSIQYGELARLFLTWMEALGLPETRLSFDPSAEAVPNRVRGTTPDGFAKRLEGVFSECARTLAPTGRLILTFHTTNFRGWASLGGALSRAGFRVAALAVVQVENSTDHSRRGKAGFLSDLVMECLLSPRGDEPRIITPPRTPEERELLYAGLSIAASGDQPYEGMRDDFLRRTRRMRRKRIEVPRSLYPELIGMGG